MRSTINTEKLAAAVRTKRGKTTLRDAEKETGLNKQTILKVEQGGMPSLPTFATLCHWLEVPADFFFKQDNDHAHA